MSTLRHFTLFFLFMLTACAQPSEQVTASSVKKKIEACSYSENCYLIDEIGNIQMLNRPREHFSRISDVCLRNGTHVEIMSEEPGSGSKLVFADCYYGEEKTAQITDWIFDDGRYNLTIQNCVREACVSRYRPI